MAETEKELQQLKKRAVELSEKSYRQNCYTFTGFLSLAEQEILRQELGKKDCGSWELWGGSEGCERLVARFGAPEELGYEEPYPIVCLHISPLSPKFAEELSHRDYLGALMNLGIDRDRTGDILIQGKEAWIYCLEAIAPFICDSLQKIRHTNVTCVRTENQEHIPVREPEEETFLVSSERIDGMISKVYKLTRSESLELFRMKKVYLNGRLCENNSYPLKAGECVNARGYGKFLYYGVQSVTKKDKLNVRVGVYRG